MRIAKTVSMDMKNWELAEQVAKDRKIGIWS